MSLSFPLCLKCYILYICYMLFYYVWINLLMDILKLYRWTWWVGLSGGFDVHFFEHWLMVVSLKYRLHMLLSSVFEGSYLEESTCGWPTNQFVNIRGVSFSVWLPCCKAVMRSSRHNQFTRLILLGEQTTVIVTCIVPYCTHSSALCLCPSW